MTMTAPYQHLLINPISNEMRAFLYVSGYAKLNPYGLNGQFIRRI